jgi:hypothetical protein
MGYEGSPSRPNGLPSIPAWSNTFLVMEFDHRQLEGPLISVREPVPRTFWCSSGALWEGGVIDGVWTVQDSVLTVKQTVRLATCEVVTAVRMLMNFWVLEPCRLDGRCQRFGETYCLHHQGWICRQLLPIEVLLKEIRVRNGKKRNKVDKDKKEIIPRWISTCNFICYQIYRSDNGRSPS